MSNQSQSHFKFKRDHYSRARGGTSKWLAISCAACAEPLLCYQKDGAGPLLRLYWDRIVAPEPVAGLEDSSLVVNLFCWQCHKLIGIPMIYAKENRPAFRLVPGSFNKKTIIRDL